MAEKKVDRGTTVRKTAQRVSAATQTDLQTLHFRRKNWMLFGGGILSILIGFAVLRSGDITVAPFLLLAGYLVLIPWALVAQSKEKKDQGNGEAAS